MSMDSGVWVAAILTIAAFSFLYKENKLYRAVEHIFVGIGAGYSVVMGYGNIVSKAWNPITKSGQMYLLIPVALGLLLFTRFIRGSGWLARIPLAFLVGMGAAVALRGAIDQQLVKQIQATMVPLNSLENIVLMVGTATVLSYFFLSFKKSQVLTASMTVGRWVMMITFGAGFGNAVMGRISLSIGIMQFMFGNWIKLIK